MQVQNPWSVNPTKWPNTLKQFVAKFPTNCLSVFDHFVKLALKGLRVKNMIKTFKVESSDTGTAPIIFRKTATSNAKVVAQRKYCRIRASYATFMEKSRALNVAQISFMKSLNFILWSWLSQVMREIYPLFNIQGLSLVFQDIFTMQQILLNFNLLNKFAKFYGAIINTSCTN